MNIQDKSKLTQLAFYTAVAASIHIVEDIIMRMLPLPLSDLVFLTLLFSILFATIEFGKHLSLTSVKLY